MHIIIPTLALFVALLMGCSDTDNKKIEQRALSKSISSLLMKNEFESINFAMLAGNEWSKVCFFGPYSDSSFKELGFDWRVSEHTDVLRSDSHNVIVFATDSKVINYVVHNRGDGDFWKLSRKCFQRDSSDFIKDPSSGSWKNYIQISTQLISP